MSLRYYSHLPGDVAAVQTNRTLAVRVTDLREPTNLVFFRKKFRSYQAAKPRAQKGMTRIE